MTARGLFLVPIMITALALGLSTGQGLYYLFFGAVALLLAVGLAACLWLKATLRCTVSLRERRVDRGKNVHMACEMSHRCLLPVSDARVGIRCGDTNETALLRLAPFKDNILETTLPALHVGTVSCGITRAEATDAFGLFRCRIRVPEELMLAVLPLPFDMEDMGEMAGEEGVSQVSRAQEDYAAPEDVRKYLPGDALKRMHWKLSVRKQELMVRQYETPAPPDHLLIMDPYRPCTEDESVESYRIMCDAVTETVCSAAKACLDREAPVRVPFYRGGGAFVSDKPEMLLTLRDTLARQDFSAPGEFEKVLLLEARELIKTGAVEIVTTRLNPPVVEAAGRLRQQGPGTRLYYITDNPEQADRDPLVARLQHYMVEVCYVTP